MDYRVSIAFAGRRQVDFDDGVTPFHHHRELGLAQGAILSGICQEFRQIAQKAQ
jgi:hypothetical protein